MEKTNKLSEFSILRAIGALSVITIHSTSFYVTFSHSSLSYLFLGIINKFCNYAVPLFLFLSIALLTYNTLNKDNLNILEFYKKRFLKTIPVFILYVFIYYIYLKSKNVNLISIKEDLLTFFTSYILQGSIYHHLYFMPIIFQLYILFPIIYFFTKKIKSIRLKINPLISFIISFAILILLQFAFQIIHKYYIWPYYQNPAIILFTYTLPIGMGIWIGANYKNFKNSRAIKILSLLIAIISGYFLIRYTLFPTITLHNLVLPIYTASISIVLLSISIFIKNKINFIKPILYKISEFSMTIYLTHPIILDIFRKNIPAVNISTSVFINNIIYFITLFSSALGFSYLIALIISKIFAKK